MVVYGKIPICCLWEAWERGKGWTKDMKNKSCRPTIYEEEDTYFNSFTKTM